MADEQSGSGVAEGLPSYARAFEAVVNVDVAPSVTVARPVPGALAEADRLWLEHARTTAVIDGEGCFLLRGADRDWGRVHRTSHTALSAALLPRA